MAAVARDVDVLTETGIRRPCDEVAEYEPGRRMVMRTAADGPFPMETTYTWQPLDDGTTRMTLRNRGRPSGFSALAAPFMAAAMRRANTKDLAAPRTRLEGVN
ncbi:MAG: SRPBCC family protein [Blastococcus sp.]